MNEYVLQGIDRLKYIFSAILISRGIELAGLIPNYGGYELIVLGIGIMVGVTIIQKKWLK